MLCNPTTKIQQFGAGSIYNFLIWDFQDDEFCDYMGFTFDKQIIVSE
jgi:hypothetical protein